MAIDREQIRDVALGGLGTPTAATPPGFVESCDPSAVPSAARDLDQARQLLADNSAEDLSFTLIASPVLPQLPLIAQVIQQNLAEIGVDVEIAQLEVGDWQTAGVLRQPGHVRRRHVVVRRLRRPGDGGELVGPGSVRLEPGLPRAQSRRSSS